MVEPPVPIPEKLSSALPALLREANEPQSTKIEKLTGDASNRMYFRVHCPKATYVAMKLAETGPNSLAEEITKTTRKITELPFLDIGKYLTGKGVHVPKVLGYDEPRGVILLEDLGDRLLADAAQENLEAAETLYENALDQLARFAPISANDPRTSVAFSRTFDRDLYLWEFVHFVEYALDKRLKKPPTTSDRQRIIDGLSRVIDEYLSWDRVFCHRDYHSRNLMISPKSSDLGVIDFQDALLAPAYYDLVSLLRDSYVDLGELRRTRLVKSYRARIQKYQWKGTASADEFQRDFDVMGLHRNLKAAGRFCYIDEVKKNPRYLADVPRTLSYVEETLRRHSDLGDLRTYLLPMLPEVSEACRR